MNDYINMIFNQDVLEGIQRIPNASIDLIIADPPYGLGKDYGNGSDKLKVDDYLPWMERWMIVRLASARSSEGLSASLAQ